MAARFGVARVFTCPLVGTTPKSILGLATAPNHAIRITELGVSFDGVVNTNKPGDVQLVLCSADGTGTGLLTTAFTNVSTAGNGSIHKLDEGVADSLDTSGKHTYTVEPTYDRIYGAWFVHPQTGLVLPANDLGMIIVPAGKFVVIRCAFVADVNVHGYLKFEE